jgi:prepilin-type N-terminal cleavage/methylation domain-containing protein
VNRNTEVTTGSRHQLRGFSLLEIAIVLAILGFVLTIGLKSTGAYLSAERRQTTVARLAGIDAALVNYVALQKRLPCPADGRLATGVEVPRDTVAPNIGTCTVAALNNGVVPWVTLGITEAEAQDGWGNRISYRTSRTSVVALTIDNKMDMSLCDPAAAIEPVPSLANRPTPTCTATTPPLHYLWGLGRGLEVRNEAGDKLMDPYPALPALPAVQVPPSPTGAAYLLISHGENRAGAYSSSGQIQIGEPPALTAIQALEDRNKNRPSDASGQTPAYYVDAQQSDVAGTQFDDIVLRPTIMSVVTRAGLGPRKP